MKVHCQGSRFHASQIQRVEDGFRALGHEVTNHISDASLVYVNNPWFDQVLADRTAGRFAPGTKLILDVQDIPHHISDYPIDRLADQLKQADAVTAISETTARDLKAATGIDATVVYQPIMRVGTTNERKYPEYRAMFVGRVGDSNKRALIAARALSLVGFRGEEIVTVGMEPPFFGGDYWGVASETTLNDLYNSVDFVVATARYAGLELAVLEAMAVGAIPLCLRDLHTLDELLPADLFPEYRAIEPTAESLARFITDLFSDDTGETMASLKQRLYTHFETTWSARVSPAGVAGRILAVYDSIT